MISDYHMPNLNGCELGTKVKELNGNIKVILTSAYYSIVDNNLNFEFVEKPFTLQNLLDKVNFYLEDDNPTVHHYQRGKDEIC